MTELSRYTWDQATIIRLATANGFRALGLNPATVRWWASEGLITAVGKAPGGAHLYDIAEVSVVADRPRRRPGRTSQKSTLAESPSIAHNVEQVGQVCPDAI